MDADQVRDLPTAIYPTRAGAAGSLALPQADDQLLAKLAYWQRVNGVVDGFTAGVNVFKSWELHTSKFAGNLLRRKALSQQVDNQLEQFSTRIKLTGRPADRTALAHLLVGLVGRVGRCSTNITANLPADGRGTAIKHSSNRSLAQALELANLDGDAFFNAELLVRHAHTVPERSVLHSVFAANHGI